MTSKILVSKNSKKRIAFYDVRGVWAKRGEYLMLWRNEFSGHPTLEVFTTQGLSEKSKGVRHRCEHGLLRWNAWMLEGEDACVAIHTVAASGEHRIHLWDLDSDVIKSEVVFDLRPERDINVSNWKMNGISANDIVESTAPFESREAFVERVVEDTHRKFCISDNCEWAVVFSWRSHSCALCSLSSSFAMWSFSVPEDITFDPFRMRNQVMFDRHGRPLLLGDAAILVASPTFLSCVREKERLEYFPNDEAEIDSYLTSTLIHIPTSALAKVIAAKGTGLDSLEHDEQRMKVQSITDVAVSCRGDLVAMIARLKEQEVVVVGQAAGLARAHHRGCWPVFSLRDNTAYDRVFFFKDSQGDDIMVLLSVSSNEATFCKLSDEFCENKTIEIGNRIWSVTQTQDRQKLIILTYTGVFIYDLLQNDIQNNIVYFTNFEQIDDMVCKIKGQSLNQSARRLGSSNLQVSDNGRTVLVAWDAKNEKSITVYPDMRLEEYTSKINAAGASISRFCSLSHDGRTTFFVDIKALSWGLLVVGIFEESNRRVVRRVVLQSLSRSLSKKDEDIFLDNVFYDVTPDGASLIAVRTPCSELKSASLDECIVKFDIRHSDAQLINYEHLAAQPIAHVDTTLKESYGHFGGCVFNAPQNGWTSLFQEAILRRRWDIVDRIQQIAQENDVQLSIQSSRTTERDFILENLLMSESTNDILKAMDLVCSTMTPFKMVADGMCLAFRILSFKYPYIIQKALSSNAVKQNICELDVHVDFLDAKLRRDDAVHIHTTESFMVWTMFEDPKAPGQKWRDKNEETVRRMEKSGNQSTTRVQLICIGIADAAKVGMDGIIRLLLMQNAPSKVFKLDIVKWVIMYKWKIWRKRSLWHLAIYIGLLGAYTTYALFLGSSADVFIEPLWKKGCMTAALCIVFAFGCQMLKEEVTQAKTFIKDGLKLEQKWTWGLRYHFLSRWNCVDLFSCMMLVVVLPLFHGLAIFGCGFEEALSAFVAIEAIVAALKLWYFCQPYRATGALVLMVNNIVRDCLAFLLLTVFVLFGFALALYVLFRHAVNDELTGDMSEEVSDAFSSFPRSVLTLFYALLANFEPAVFSSAARLTLLVVVIFSLYLVIEYIVLFNLLIAIMGDTFDRVKSTQEDQLLMGRAIFIDSCEAAMSKSEIEALNKEIGKYVCVLMPLGEESEVDQTDEWKGRMKALEESFYAAIKNSEKKLMDMMQLAVGGMKEEMQQSMVSVNDLKKEVQQSMVSVNDLKKEVQQSMVSIKEEMKEEMQQQLAQVVDTNTARFTDLEAKMEQMSRGIDTIVSLMQHSQET